MTELPDTARRSWNRFLNTYEPLRGDLYRYCRYLTRSPWDAEDLAQDTLARAFVTLAKMGHEPANPRAWLFRVASNLWIDQVRRRRERPLEDSDIGSTTTEPRAPREAAGTLLVTLSPQERAAVVLKDVFDLSLEEIADSLGSTVGGIKAALHRGRGKLVDEPVSEPTTTPAPGALDKFVAAFTARDMDGLVALLLDNASVEVVGATVQYGPEAARRTVFHGMLWGSQRMAEAATKGGMEARYVEGVLPVPPRIEVRFHRDRWVAMFWYEHADGVEAVRAFATFELEGDRISHMTNYFFTPEIMLDLGAELGVPIRVNGHRWWLPGEGPDPI